MKKVKSVKKVKIFSFNSVKISKFVMVMAHQLKSEMTFSDAMKKSWSVYNGYKPALTEFVEMVNNKVNKLTALSKASKKYGINYYDFQSLVKSLTSDVVTKPKVAKVKQNEISKAIEFVVKPIEVKPIEVKPIEVTIDTQLVDAGDFFEIDEMA